MSKRGRPDHADVPENKFGLTDPKELQKLETPLALRRLLELQLHPLPGNFDTKHLCSIHRYIFQDVYPWAGELRSVTIAKAGAPFPPPEHLRQSLDTLFAELEEENRLRRLPASTWAHRAAYLFGEINAIHPFREGNGRTQREFIRELALECGHGITWARCTQQGMIHASQISFMRRDYSELERILVESMRPAE
jgi:cell filamentation protein